MDTHRVIINSQTYLVHATDVPRLKEKVVRAVHAGGDFVTFDADDGHQVTQLISAHSRVTIEWAAMAAAISSDDALGDWEDAIQSV
ncbi:MAG: hypothetical protein H7146_07325 [Burkholderiaceae bacterium]|nr:hypothetical protein [Microbacteriaceae bacterium]